MVRYLAEFHGFCLCSRPNGCLLAGIKQEGGTNVTRHSAKAMLVVVWTRDEGASVNPG